MKTRKTNLLLTLSIFFVGLVFSCCSGDDGEMGPEGKQGAKGDQGIQGEVGPAGKDGSIIYSGEGTPNAETGLAGDYYLDTQTGKLYGPKKSDDLWDGSESFSLKGDKGDAGQDGNVILSGVGAPGLDIGNAGDFYLDKQTYSLYGPKTGNKGQRPGWGPALLLKGAEGNANVKTYILKIYSDDWEVYDNDRISSYKYSEYRAVFPAMTKDIYDNGIVLAYWVFWREKFILPYIRYTHDLNLMRHYFSMTYDLGYEEYTVKFVNCLQAYQDPTELLPIYNEFTVEIKVITGKAAEILSVYKDNEKELYSKAKEMGID